MAHTAYTWSTGDLISAARLNNLEVQYDQLLADLTAGIMTASVNSKIVIHGKVAASETLIVSNNAEKTTTSTTYVKLKSMEIYANIRGTIRVKFELKNNTSSKYTFAKVYKSGVAVGVEKTNTLYNTAYEAESDDVAITLVPGDTLEIWAHVDSGSTAYIRNMSICGTIGQATAAAVANDP